MATVGMFAPTSGASVFTGRSGTVYSTDGFGYVAINVGQDVSSALDSGFTFAVNSTGRSNFNATTDPSKTSDSALDYAVGSRWFNTTSGQFWECVNATASAAVWFPIGARFVGRLLAANMNSTADQQITLYVPATALYRVTKITVKNASVSLTTAVGGVYPTTAKGGTALVANTQVYTALSTSALALDLTLATATAVQPAATPLYLALTTAQGSAATADVYVYADVYI